MTSPKQNSRTIGFKKQGFVKLWRCVQDNPLYNEKRQFSRWEAFEYLILNSAHCPHSVVFMNRAWHVRRGEVITSIRHLANVYGWSRSKVERFFKLLKELEMIETSADRDATRIRILNWEKYQGDTIVAETVAGHERDTEKATAEPRGKNGNKNILDNKIYINTYTAAFADGAPSHLKRFPDPLIACPLPSQPGSVWMTEKSWKRLQEMYGQECAWHICDLLEEWAADNPASFKKKKDHFRTALNLHKRKLGDGYEFYAHPEKGHGYYRLHVVRQFRQEAA